jgi:hypothetical protein
VPASLLSVVVMKAGSCKHLTWGLAQYFMLHASLSPQLPACLLRLVSLVQGDDEDGTLPFELAVLEAGLAEVCSHLAGGQPG